jgi:hypothetical protein
MSMIYDGLLFNRNTFLSCVVDRLRTNPPAATKVLPVMLIVYRFSGNKIK